jgi:hypothetical protein
VTAVTARKKPLLQDRTHSRRWSPAVKPTGKGIYIMATIEYKAGDYQIGPSSSQQFTFWCGLDSRGVSEYFNVSIAPDLLPNNLPQLPLVEEQPAYLLDMSQTPGRIVLLLTLRNDNNFAVYLTANHIRIY